MKNILFIVCSREKGDKIKLSGLYNSASFVSNFLNETHNSKIVAAVDGNDLDRLVTENNADIVIIEALWVTPAKFNELLSMKQHKSRRWIVRIHSKAPFLANEGIATQWIYEYSKISGLEISPNTIELTNQLKIVFEDGKFLYLPNIPPPFEKVEKIEFSESAIFNKNDYINIGCFGAIRPMKNQYQQAIAAIHFCEKMGKVLRFHINASRAEQGGDNALKNIRALFEGRSHYLVEHDWYEHSGFLSLCASMDIGMQVSFSESFNIVTADMVTTGVPVIVSTDIEWMPNISKVVPSNHKQLINRLWMIYFLKPLFVWLQKRNLEKFTKQAKQIWKNNI